MRPCRGANTFGVRVNEEWAASGRFLASGSGATPAIAKGFRRYGWVLIAVFISPFVYAVTTGRNLPGGAAAIPAGCVVVFMLSCFIPLLSWLRNRRILICVTGDGLIVDKRRGVDFPYSDMQLGLWNFGMYGGTTMGTALHMRNGRHRFVLGGKDHRIGAGTRLEAPPLEYVDASMSASDFDGLLAMIASRSGLNVRRPAPGEPTRCLLFPCPAWFFSDTLVGEFAAMSRPITGFDFNPEPSLAIDVGNDAIWVRDANTNEVLASAPIAQLNVVPAVHTYYRKSGQRSPVLVVRVPGLQERIGAKRPLTITCRDVRFRSWSCPVHEEQPAFVVSGMDWLFLVEKFGLAPYMGMRTGRGF